jgi:hypothetical protein
LFIVPVPYFVAVAIVSIAIVAIAIAKTKAPINTKKDILSFPYLSFR